MQECSLAPTLGIIDPLGDGEGETLPLFLLQLYFYSFLMELSHELDCALPSDKHFGQDSA